MIRYEALLLTVPTVTQDEAKNIESQIDRVVKENKGSMISFEKWGKYRLAYPVKKNDYGVYFLARFETEESKALVNELKTLMAVRLNDLVMRDMVTALDPKESLEYQRPQSLEETPTREMSGFADRREASHAQDEDIDSELEQERD